MNASKKIAIILVSISLYNILILLKANYADIPSYIFAQFAFTYQNVGFISRGLIPSIFNFFNIDSLYEILFFYNIVLLVYLYTFLTILDRYSTLYKDYIIFCFIFLFFGIPHFAVDTFKLDLFSQTFTLLYFLYLQKKQYVYAILFALVGFFIHEAILFLIIPITFLLVEEQKLKYILSVFFGIIFIIISIMSTHLSEAQSVEILKAYLNIETIPQNFYVIRTASIKDNIIYFFSTNNMAFLFMVSSIYLIVAVYIFKSVIFSTFKKYGFLMLFPLALFPITIDWLRWICFIYFLGILFSIQLNLFSKKIFYACLFLTISLGIPIHNALKFSVLLKILKQML